MEYGTSETSGTFGTGVGFQRGAAGGSHRVHRPLGGHAASSEEPGTHRPGRTSGHGWRRGDAAALDDPGAELVVTGTFRYANTWPTAIGLVATRSVHLDRLVSSRHTLEQTVDALVAGRTDAKTIKAVILPQR
jgi:hypothetical protein